MAPSYESAINLQYDYIEQRQRALLARARMDSSARQYLNPTALDASNTGQRMAGYAGSRLTSSTGSSSRTTQGHNHANSYGNTPATANSRARPASPANHSRAPTNGSARSTSARHHTPLAPPEAKALTVVSEDTEVMDPEPVLPEPVIMENLSPITTKFRKLLESKKLLNTIVWGGDTPEVRADIYRVAEQIDRTIVVDCRLTTLLQDETLSLRALVHGISVLLDARSMEKEDREKERLNRTEKHKEWVARQAECLKRRAARQKQRDAEAAKRAKVEAAEEKKRAAAAAKEERERAKAEAKAERVAERARAQEEGVGGRGFCCW